MLQGALIGSVGLAALQYLTGILIGSFAKNPTAALFGPFIVLMLFFNIFARMTLYVAGVADRDRGSPQAPQVLPLVVDSAPEAVRDRPGPGCSNRAEGHASRRSAVVGAGLALGALLAAPLRRSSRPEPTC